MLVLSRKKGECVVINGNIKVFVVDVRRDLVRLGIEAPEQVEVLRSELVDKNNKEGESIDLTRCNNLQEPLQ